MSAAVNALGWAGVLVWSLLALHCAFRRDWLMVAIFVFGIVGLRLVSFAFS